MSEIPLTATGLKVADVLRKNRNIPTEKLHADLIKWAARNKITPFLANKLVRQGVDDAALAKWSQSVREAIVARNLQVLAELQSLFERFHKEDVSGVIVVENFGTLVATDGDLADFASGDVDLMARKSDEFRASVILQKAGWKKTVRRGLADNIMATFEKEICNAPFFLNFEWKFVSRRFFACETALAARLEYWRENGQVVSRSGIDVLNDDANFYLNCLHISVGHYFGTNPGLRLYKDIEPYLTSADFSTKQALLWAREDGTLLRIEACLALYKELFDNQYEMPISACSKAKHITDLVSSIHNEHELVNFSLWQEIRIDSLAEGMFLPSYLFRRGFATLFR